MRTMVKSFVVGTLGLAVLFGSPAPSLALPKAGGVECNGPLDHLPPGKMCPKGYEETNLHRQDGTCEVNCCRDTPDGKLVCGAPPVDVKLQGPRNVRPNLPATIYEPSAPVPPGGVKLPITPGQPLVAATTSPSVSQIAASVNIPAFSSGSVAAECPVGTRVTGGGYTIGGYFSLNLINSSMIGNAWRVVASTSSGSNGQLTAYAICVSGLSGTTTQVGKQISIPAQTSQGNTVTCPSGTTVTGGGFSQNNVDVFLTEQNQNGWTTSAKSGNSSGLLNTYAICYGPASLSTFTVGTQVVVAAKGEGQAAAECPQGSLVTGGGFAINPPGNGRVHTMLKIGNAWRAVLKNLPTGTSSVLSVFATCMNPSPGPAGVRPTVAPGLKQP